MSGTLFSSMPRRYNSRYHRAVTTNERQGDGSARPPPSEGGWLCDEPYKYSARSSKNPLEICNEIVEGHDESNYRQLKEEINFLMVVAGLFLAIVAAFTVESYKFLQEDKQDTMSDLLVEVVRLLNDTSAQGKAQLPKPFMPTHHALVVNQLWFLSMILSLIAVAIGTFCLQWISALSRGSNLTDKSIPPHESLALRQLRHEGLIGWGVRHAPEALLLIVQLSIGLFTCGLIYFLWNVSKRTTIPALVATGFAGALLCLVNLIPFLQPLVGAFIPATLDIPQCPYKSPISWLAQNTGNLSLYTLKLFLNLLTSDSVEIIDRPRRWLTSLPIPFTDFDWKKYDKTCQDLRECVRSRLSYFESGLISALDHSTFEGEVMDIISSYLKNLAPFFATAQVWEMFSQEDLSNGDKSFLNDKFTVVSHHLPRHLNTMPLQLEHVDKIRIDFISALILQHLTRSNERLARLSFRHRLELYIRIKNSTEFILGRDGSRIDFGTSLRCPLQGQGDFGDLDLDLKVQFLRCAKHLIDIRRFTDLDLLGAAAIVKSEKATSFKITLPADGQNLSETPDTDFFAEEGHEEPHPAQESRIRDLGKNPDHGTASSSPNHLERDGSQSIAPDMSPEDPQLRDSLTNLCSQLQERLSQLRVEDFKDVEFYPKLRRLLGLPPPRIPFDLDIPAVGTEDV